MECYKGFELCSVEWNCWEGYPPASQQQGQNPWKDAVGPHVFRKEERERERERKSRRFQTIFFFQLCWNVSIWRPCIFFIWVAFNHQLVHKIHEDFVVDSDSGLGCTWLSQEVSKRLGSVGYNPDISHLQVGYNPFTNHLLNFLGHPSRMRCVQCSFVSSWNSCLPMFKQIWFLGIRSRWAQKPIYKWTKINGFHWGHFTSFSRELCVVFYNGWLWACPDEIEKTCCF